jgi:hypothetical protein
MFNIFDLLLRGITPYCVLRELGSLFTGKSGSGARCFALHIHFGIMAELSNAVLLVVVPITVVKTSATEASVFMDGFTLEMFLANCLEENARRMSVFDPKLLQPQLLPGLATVALSALKRLSGILTIRAKTSSAENL